MKNLQLDALKSKVLRDLELVVKFKEESWHNYKKSEDPDVKETNSDMFHYYQGKKQGLLDVLDYIMSLYIEMQESEQHNG